MVWYRTLTRQTYIKIENKGKTLHRVKRCWVEMVHHMPWKPISCASLQIATLLFFKLTQDHLHLHVICALSVTLSISNMISATFFTCCLTIHEMSMASRCCNLVLNSFSSVRAVLVLRISSPIPLRFLYRYSGNTTSICYTVIFPLQVWCYPDVTCHSVIFFASNEATMKAL